MRTLGGFGVDVDGSPVDVDSLPRRPRQLVKLLALSPNRRLLRDQVIEALFAHLDPDAGAANLHKAASLVRRTAGDRRAVVLDAGVVALWPDTAVEIDAEAFEACARAALAAGDGAACRQAAATYRELLPAERYEAWTERSRERLRRLEVELWRASGDWARLLEVDPIDEAAHREAMREQAAAGNRAGVVRQFRRLRDALGAELGLGPADETLRLFETLTHGAPPRAPVAAPGPLVGRRVEVARARAAWKEAEAGRGGGLVVRGEAGIGKTRLCEALLADAAAAGWATLRGTGSRVEATIPYAPIVEIVDRVVIERPDLVERLPEVARLVLGQLTAAARRATTPDREPLARQQVVSAVARLVAGAAKECGVVVLVDDLHAADDDTVALFHYLVRAATFQRVLVVGAIRAGEERPTVADVRRGLVADRRAVDIELGPLSLEEATTLLTDGDMGVIAADRAEALWRQAGGNPFLLRELATGAPPGDIPVGVTSVIEARLSGLDPALRDALERVAVAGEVVTFDELAALASLADDEAQTIIDAALAAALLEEHDGAYRFRHGLVREAMVAALPGHRRSVAHREAAAALAAVGAPAARVAHHLLAGERPAEAVPHLAAAAHAAVGVGAYRDARGFVERALEVAAGDPDLLALRADMVFATGDPAAPAAYAEAVRAAPADAAGPVLVRQARAHVAAGDPAAAAGLLAAASVAAAPDRALRQLLQAQVAWMTGDLAAAEAGACQARVDALSCGATEVVLGSMTLLDLVLHQQGRWPERVRLDLLESGNAPLLAAVLYDAHLCGAEAYLYGGRPYEEVKAFAREIAEEARRGGATRGLAFAVTLLGEAELLTGELGRAAENLGEGIRLHEAVAAEGGEALARQRLAEVFLAISEPDRAQPLLHEALHLARSSRTLAWHLVARVYGTMVLAAPTPEAAVAVVDEAEIGIVGGMVEACPPCSVALWIPAAVACARANQPARGRGFAALAEPFVHAAWPGGGWRAALDEAYAHLVLAEGDEAGARGYLDRAARRFEAVGQPLDFLRCHETAKTIPRR